MSEFAISVESVTKDFGAIVALEGLTFHVGKQEVYGLIGPNGAGKTTCLRILATLIKPSSGSAKVFGLDVERDADTIRSIISYLPEEAGAYRNLSGREYLRFMAGFYTAEVDEMVDVASGIAGLEHRLHDKVKTYSKGMTRRLLIARALMMRPKLAILDEPTSGLDVIHAYYIRRIIRQFVDDYGVTVLLSSHNMLEVDFLCTHVALIDNGRIRGEGSPAELKSTFGAENLEEVFMEATRRA